MRDGTAEPVSRDQNLRRERGQGNVNFSFSADHEQDCILCYLSDVYTMPVMLLIQTFSELSLQLKKLRSHNESARDLLNVCQSRLRQQRGIKING